MAREAYSIVQVDQETHRQIKIRAAQHNMTMSEYVSYAVRHESDSVDRIEIV